MQNEYGELAQALVRLKEQDQRIEKQVIGELKDA